MSPSSSRSSRQRPANGSGDDSYDLIVVGAGCAGMSAALFAAIDGLKVLLLERTEWVGGTTALSAGAVWVPNTHLADGSGDTPEKAARYLELATEGRSPERLRNAFLRQGAEAIRVLQAESEVRLRAFAYHPDYLSSLEGSTTSGRVLESLPFDGRLLGDAFELVRAPIPEFTVLGGMMVDRTDIGHLLKLSRSWPSLAYSTRLVWRHLRDRLRHPRGTRLVMGNGLVGRLLLSLLQRGVPILTQARTLSLDAVNGRVTGVTVSVANAPPRKVSARLGVILASGGFNGHPGFRARFISPDVTHSPRAPTSTGELQAQALALGARFGDAQVSSAFWAPVSVQQRKDGSTAVFPHFVLDRAKPGTLVVNRAGHRFLNESSSYHLFGKRMIEANADGSSIPAFLIADRMALVKYGLGMVRPGGRGLDAFLRSGYLVEAPSLAELARKLDIDASGLQRSVRRMNTFARSGIDEDFHRGSTVYEKNLGDATVQPNPTLGEVAQAPFYAIRLYPGDIGASTGLVTDEQARVMAGNAPIDGLFAIGNDMQSVMAGAYPGPGINLGPAIAFAYAAVKAAQSVQSAAAAMEHRQ
jgi:hypothetical protein